MLFDPIEGAPTFKDRGKIQVLGSHLIPVSGYTSGFHVYLSRFWEALRQQALRVQMTPDKIE